MYMWKMIILASSVAFMSSAYAETKVLAFSGSTREDSINGKLIKEAAEIAGKNGATVTVVNLQDFPMPFYNADVETNEGMPAKAKELRQLMLQNQVIFIASPEYNASLTAVLKNVIDWASRDEKSTPSRDAFKGKKFVIMSASPGPGGGSRGLAHLKDILTAVGGTVITPEFVLPNSSTAFDEQGHLKDRNQAKALEAIVQKALIN